MRFYRRLILFCVMGMEFENTCKVSGKWNISRFVSRLYGWVYKTFLEFLLYYLNCGFPVGGLPLSGFPIGGYNYGFPIRGTPAQILWVANFWSSWNLKFVFRISGGMKFWDLSGGLRHWRQFDCRSDRMLMNFAWKVDVGEIESINK